MRTAMQKLIDHFTFYSGNYSCREEILAKAENLLEQEKNQIGMAFTDGFYSGCDQPMFDDMPDKYYEKTFKP